MPNQGALAGQLPPATHASEVDREFSRTGVRFPAGPLTRRQNDDAQDTRKEAGSCATEAHELELLRVPSMRTRDVGLRDRHSRRAAGEATTGEHLRCSRSSSAVVFSGVKLLWSGGVGRDNRSALGLERGLFFMLGWRNGRRARFKNEYPSGVGVRLPLRAPKRLMPGRGEKHEKETETVGVP